MNPDRDVERDPGAGPWTTHTHLKKIRKKNEKTTHLRTNDKDYN
jgi:hypothetical protein